MSPFGFTPDNNDEENPKPDDFAAMMRQMQEQIQKQFQELGINPAGFINPFANFAPGAKGQQEALFHPGGREDSRHPRQEGTDTLPGDHPEGTGTRLAQH